MTLPPTFVEKIRHETNGCWLWTGAKRSGYGAFWYDGHVHRAHRFAYQIVRGPVPEGLVLDHLCRDPSCVNPAHLEAVTQAVNLARGLQPRKTRCNHGHPFDEANTRLDSNGWRSCWACYRARAGAKNAHDRAKYRENQERERERARRYRARKKAISS